MYVSLVCSISRLGSESLILDNLYRVLGIGEYEIVFIVDNKDFKIFSFQRDIERMRNEFRIRNITILNTGKPPPSAFTMHQRRTRIANNHNLIKEHLGSSRFVFGFEDDTELPVGALDKLIDDFRSLHNPGIVEGVQVGRWGKGYIGAWHVDDVNKPTEYTSLKLGEFLDPIDAGGFYCFLTPTSLYKEHEFKWNEPLGPDVEYSLSLRQQGYQNYIDWDVRTKHLTQDKALEVSKETPTMKLTYDGRWKP